MNDPFANYDSWLSEPYERMMEESDRFLDWADEYDYDLGNPEEAIKAQMLYDEYLQELYEDQAEAQYEAYLDRKADEAQEREWDDARW